MTIDHFLRIFLEFSSISNKSCEMRVDFRSYKVWKRPIVRLHDTSMTWCTEVDACVASEIVGINKMFFILVELYGLEEVLKNCYCYITVIVLDRML